MNNNTKTKNTKSRNSFAAKLILVPLVTFAVFSASCSISGFGRGTATEMIKKDNRYVAPATMTIDAGKTISNVDGETWQISRDDTAEAAAVRLEQDFSNRQPQLAVAENLGYIKIYFENPELEGKQLGMPYELYHQDLGVWYFKVRIEATDKGRELWKELNLPVDEKSLPLAVRGTPEVTGIQDENQTMKAANFTYQWQLTELGKVFDPSSDEFKKLPSNLQEALQKTQFNIFGSGGNNTANFKTPRSAKAFFQKFDDGWRIGQLYFM